MRKRVFTSVYFVIAGLTEFLLIQFLNMHAFHVPIILSALLFFSLFLALRLFMRLRYSYSLSIPAIVIMATYIGFSFYSLSVKFLLIGISLVILRIMFHNNLNLITTFLPTALSVLPFYLAVLNYFDTGNLYFAASILLILFASTPFKIKRFYYGIFTAFAGLFSLSFIYYGNIFYLLLSAALIVVEILVNELMVIPREK